MNKASQLTITLLLSAGAAFSQLPSDAPPPRGSLLRPQPYSNGSVPAATREQLQARREAADQRALYDRSRAMYEQRYQDCIKRPSQFQGQNNCQQEKNTADYYAGMSAAVPNPDLTGSVTGQPLPAPGATRGLGGIIPGTCYGVGTQQCGPVFNKNSQTISTKPVIDARTKIDNSRGRAPFGAWRQQQ